jgi:cytochrome P450
MTNPHPRTAPGPRGDPLLGHVLRAWREPISLMVEAASGYGDVALLRFGPFLRYYVLGSVGGVHHVLQANAKNYVKSRNYAGLKYVLGHGLLTSEGEFWKRQRRLAQPAFHHQRLPRFAETMARLANEHAGRWPVGETVDMHAAMMRLTFRIVGQTLFSADVEGDAAEIGEALEVGLRWAQDYAEQIVRVPPWVPTPSNVRFRRALSRLDALVLRIIRERMASASDPDDLVGLLMAVRDEVTGERMSERQLRDEVMTIVLAGHETTANALAFTLHLLARHPEVEQRLHAEVDAELGGRAPAFGDLPRLPYAARVVQEGLRLYPPAWCFEREAIADDVIEGFHVPAGSMIALCPYTLHRSTRYWTEPERFDPDRFLPERSSDRPKQAYLPFGDGPRVCIGKAFAMMEATIILAVVAQRFRVGTTEKGAELDLDPGVTLRPRGGVSLRLWARGTSRSEAAREPGASSRAPI